MNFPLEQPIFQFLYWLVNTPGIGALVIILLAATALTSFALTLRWIASAKNAEQESYPYPPRH